MSNEVGNLFQITPGNTNSDSENNSNSQIISNTNNQPNQFLYNNESQEVSFIRRGDKRESFGDMNLSNLLIIRNPGGEVAMGYSPKKQRAKNKFPEEQNNLSIFLIHQHYGTIIQQINTINSDYPPQR